MLKNVLTRLFDFDFNVASPVRDDFVPVEKRDEDGNVFTVYEKFDYPKHQASLGLVKDWQLDNLLKAGINPNFSIHTGSNTRLEAAVGVADFASEADSILAESSEVKD